MSAPEDRVYGEQKMNESNDSPAFKAKVALDAIVATRR